MRAWKHLLRPAYGPGTVNGFGDGELRQRAVVYVAFSMTRGHLVAALMASATGVDDSMNVDELPVGEVRRLVEERAALVGTPGLDQGEVWLRLSRADLDEQQLAMLAACDRAVNRAYPPDVVGTVLVSGSPRRPAARCTAPGCQWSGTGRLEALLLDGVEHGATHECGDRQVAAETGTDRCGTAHPEDPSGCIGPVAVTVVDGNGAGVDGCEHHAARMLASLSGGRVYPLPDAPEAAAIRVFMAAGELPPYAWRARPGGGR